MGASVFNMSGALSRKLYTNVRVEASPVRLRCCSEELATVQSEAQVHVRYTDKGAVLQMFLSNRASPRLLGRTWIHALGVHVPLRQLAEVHSLADVQG